MNTKRLYLTSITLILLAVFSGSNAADKNQVSENPSAVKIEMTEVEKECVEKYSDDMIASEEDRKSLISDCVDEKIEKFKKFSDEGG